MSQKVSKKKKMACKMLTKKERKGGNGQILFESSAWKRRRIMIAAKVKQKQKIAHSKAVARKS